MDIFYSAFRHFTGPQPKKARLIQIQESPKRSPLTPSGFGLTLSGHTKMIQLDARGESFRDGLLQFGTNQQPQTLGGRFWSLAGQSEVVDHRVRQNPDPPIHHQTTPAFLVVAKHCVNELLSPLSRQKKQAPFKVVFFLTNQ